MQMYITNPFLIRGFKFDLRFYVAVQSLNPLRVYNYEDGLVRLASEPYSAHYNDIEELRAHLTNFAINKESSEYMKTDNIEEDGKGSKWSHKPFWPFMEAANFDVHKMKKEVDDAIVTILMCARPSFMKQTNHRCSFEMFGFDVLVDCDGGIHILEVNISPALGRSSKLDVHIKTPLVKDWLNMALVPKKSQFHERLESTFENPEKQELAEFLSVVEMEFAESRKGAFRRIYPTPERVKSHMKYLPGPTNQDINLARYVCMTPEQKTQYVRKMSHALEKEVDDLINCVNDTSMFQMRCNVF